MPSIWRWAPGRRRTARPAGAPHGGDLHVDLALDPVIVTALDSVTRAETVVLKADSTSGPVTVTVAGFVGSVSYALDGRMDPHAIGALVRLAPSAGTGAYATGGFDGAHAATATCCAYAYAYAS